MEGGKERFGIREWALGQCSLEDVFSQVVRRAEAEQRANAEAAGDGVGGEAAYSDASEED